MFSILPYLFSCCLSKKKKKNCTQIGLYMLTNDAQNTLSKFDFISHIDNNCIVNHGDFNIGYIIICLRYIFRKRNTARY